MQKKWKKTSLFIMVLLIKNTSFAVTMLLYHDGGLGIDSLSSFILFLGTCLTGGLGIGGILYIFTTIIYLKIDKIWKSFIFNLFALLFYIFLFQITFFPIYAVYKEILFPLLVGILSGLCYMYIHSYFERK